MDKNVELVERLVTKSLMDTLIRFAFIGTLVWLCFQIFNPFASLIIWALVLAVTLYPLHQAIAARLGGNQGRASTIIVVVGLLLLGVPIFFLSLSFVDHITNIYASWQAGSLMLPSPNPAVANWPIVGERIHSLWADAANNMDAFLATYKESIEHFARSTLAYLGKTVVAVLFFLAAYVIAGVMMAYGADGHASISRIVGRIAGPEAGPELHSLSIRTTRSVAVGVLGVALIQAVILGVGFLFAGLPAAGVLALLVLFLGILQLPTLLVSLPAIGYLWWVGDASTVSNVIWTLYLLAGGLADNVLKPILLGRGAVNTPMLVILLGAMGGMIFAGIIGLFLGAVLLAVGYQVFIKWVNEYAEPNVTTVNENVTDSNV
ncbi:AI-2E family transporter [Oceanisphaera pacifica]|uniref:AI-2E family transporter n=1 Tax=Oceanisphaera pacifica TaxID=2818389 RepID=A0ABS3NF95_9GAMM|nr:AI-2E family transporter [Oceanisphaera pacifica]MBO1519047.1 AI-2E family transporter [Oceanisphaera pacifica]